LRAQQETVVTRGVFDGFENGVFRHCNARAAALAYRAQDQEITDGLGHANTRRDRCRMLPPLGELVAVLEGADDRRAALGLDREHPRPLPPYQPHRLQLVECLPHADEACAAAGRIEDRVWKLPAELLGELQ